MAHNENTLYIFRLRFSRWDRLGALKPLCWRLRDFSFCPPHTHTHNRAAAQVPHNQDSLADEKYTKWPSTISHTRRQAAQGPHDLGKIPSQQPARDKFTHVFTNPSGLLTHPNTFSAWEEHFTRLRTPVGWVSLFSLAWFLSTCQRTRYMKYDLLLMHWYNDDWAWQTNTSTCKGVRRVSK